MYLFFFQAEDGIRDGHVTGVQTCALPIYKKFISNYLFHNHVMSVLNPAGLESNLMDKNVYSRIYSEFRQPETLLRYMRGAFYNAKYRMISSAEAERVLLNAEIEWVIKPRSEEHTSELQSRGH